MIQKLIHQIITLLRESLAGVMSDPEEHIMASPVTEPTTTALPLIALYLNKLEIRQDFQEKSSSQPRPQELRQEIAVNSSNPAGPYSLGKTPLIKSTLCQIIFDKGTATERQVVLVENEDFNINYQNATIVYSFDLSEASSIFFAVLFCRRLHHSRISTGTPDRYL